MFYKHWTDFIAGRGEEPAGEEEDRPASIAVEAVLRLVVVGDAQSGLVSAHRPDRAAALRVRCLEPLIDCGAEVELNAEAALRLHHLFGFVQTLLQLRTYHRVRGVDQQGKVT